MNLALIGKKLRITKNSAAKGHCLGSFKAHHSSSF